MTEPGCSDAAMAPNVAQVDRCRNAVVLARLVVAAGSPREFTTEDQDLAFCNAAQVFGLLFFKGENVPELHHLVIGHRTRVWEGSTSLKGAVQCRALRKPRLGLGGSQGLRPRSVPLTRNEHPGRASP
jgi:hypothetical protein